MEIGKILLSSSALALGVLASVYFFIGWRKHQDRQHARALLLWALALFLMYWFQVPAIFFSIRNVIVVTDFNLFFALTFPITLLALVFIYLGILQISKIRLGKKKKYIFALWLLSAVLFFTYHFTANQGVIETYSLPLIGNILFYLPIRILIIFVLARWLFTSKIKNIYGILGATGIIAESLFGISRNFFIIKNVLTYPPELWYATISSSKFFFITQTMSIILLVFGFFFLHFYYHRLRHKNNKRSSH